MFTPRGAARQASALASPWRLVSRPPGCDGRPRGMVRSLGGGSPSGLRLLAGRPSPASPAGARLPRGLGAAREGRRRREADRASGAPYFQPIHCPAGRRRPPRASVSPSAQWGRAGGARPLWTRGGLGAHPGGGGTGRPGRGRAGGRAGPGPLGAAAAAAARARPERAVSAEERGAGRGRGGRRGGDCSPLGLGAGVGASPSAERPRGAER